MVPRFVVKTSLATSKGRAASLGRYRNIAIVETDQQEIPKFISPRAKHLVRIVKRSGPHYEGTTERCAYRVALAEAEALAAQLNQETV